MAKAKTKAKAAKKVSKPRKVNATFRIRQISNGFIVAKQTSGYYDDRLVNETYAKDRKAASEILQGMF